VSHAVPDLLATVEQIERCVETVYRLVRSLQPGPDGAGPDQVGARLARVSAAIPSLRTQICSVANDLNARVMQDAALVVDRRIGERRCGVDRRASRSADADPANSATTEGAASRGSGFESQPDRRRSS
jgi:hypothetical protein